MKGGKCCRSLYLRVAWIPCVNGWYACWRQQQPLSQLELAWELLLNVRQSQEKKEEYFFSQISDNAMPVTVARGRRCRRCVEEEKQFVIDRRPMTRGGVAAVYAECRMKKKVETQHDSFVPTPQPRPGSLCFLHKSQGK